VMMVNRRVVNGRMNILHFFTEHTSTITFRSFDSTMD
jgi:hypothetical protein